MKKLISMMLVVVLMVGLLPMQAFASSTTPIDELERSPKKLGLSDIGSGGYRTMKTSQMLLDILKVTEGYSQKAYADNTQYSIGYGTKAKHAGEVLPNGKAGYEEAEKRLIEDIRDRENMVNNYCRNSLRKQPSQNQFDAMLSFTYNNGTSWFFGSRLASWLKNPTTEIDFMNAFGQWCHVGTTPWYSLAQRRIREALIFLKGEYYLPGRPGPQHLIKAPEFKNDPTRYVRPNGSLPYFASIIMEFDSSISGDRIEYRQYGDILGKLPTPSASGHTFGGWSIVAENDSSVPERPASPYTVVEKNLKLSAQWDSGSWPGPDEIVPPKPGRVPFIDVSDHDWYIDQVEFVYKHGYMAGTTTYRFSPDAPMTRAMLVMVLYRIAGSPAVKDEHKEYFRDTQNEYYTDAVGWAKANSIVDGVGDRRFAPSDKVTRQDAEVIFYNFCVNYLKVSSKKTADLSKFVDVEELDGYANEAVQWAVAVKMMAGNTIGGKLYLQPKMNLTRAQAAALITRCAQDIIKK